jgi:hypothetical protein
MDDTIIWACGLVFVASAVITWLFNDMKDRIDSLEGRIARMESENSPGK